MTTIRRSGVGDDYNFEGGVDRVSTKAKAIQENFDQRDNLQREKVCKRDNFPCYLT
jgi:hypothetical protein